MKTVGAHVSITGGLYKSADNAAAIGANCMQIFGGSPRQWAVKLPDQEAVDKFLSAKKQAGIGPVFLHAPYIINLASPSKPLQSKSYQAFKRHFQITNMLKAEGLIFHLGSFVGGSQARAVEQTIKYMKQALKEVPGPSSLIMEVSSGGGSKLGDTLEEVAALKKGVKSGRVGLCLDTAHAFTAGLIDYSPASIKSFMASWKRLLGFRDLQVIHANDSKADFGSKADRHEDLGKGKIGLAALKRLAFRPELSKLPWILEVPSLKTPKGGQKDIKVLKSLL